MYGGCQKRSTLIFDSYLYVQSRIVSQLGSQLKVGIHTKFLGGVLLKVSTTPTGFFGVYL